jgi:hypothetical protein
MGAIARNIANKITTAGVFTSGAITNSSVTGITVLANASDGITLISSQTASNSASISFTSGITSTYKAYKFVFANIHTRTEASPPDFSFNMSTDGGSNYNVTKTTTAFRAYHSEGGVGGALQYTSAYDLAQSTDFQVFGDQAQGADADQCTAGELLLFNPSSTTYVKHFLVKSNDYNLGDYSVVSYVAGYCNTTSAVNAIRFKMQNSNFDGTIYMYGIK